MLDTIEHNMQIAQEQTESAIKDLIKAAKLDSASSKWSFATIGAIGVSSMNVTTE